MEELQTKILEAFQGKVVRKDLAFLVKGGLPVPTYVLEYLLAQYCATDNEDVIRDGIEKVKDIIRNNYVNRAESEQIKGKIRERGRYSVIDKITVVLDDKKDFYKATFANLDLSNIPIATDIVVKNPKLLSGNGVWSIVTINYLSGEDVQVRWEIEKLKPIQISRIDVDDYKAQRSKFTTDEWIDLLIHTVGLNPEILNKREKIITLSRLLPLIENNFNFIELGPKGTGKSHIFSELSPYSVLVSGGDVTSARLFVKMSGNREILGLVGYWDLVAWDEFEQQKGRATDAVLIDTMQNYLANKSFNRGKGTHEASASMCFVGNTKHTVPYMLKNSHLFESIPTSFIKGAFLDRMHLYNPGWEVQMLKKDSFSKGYGLITDYIAAVLHELRNIDLSSEITKYVRFDGSLSERDLAGIRKTFSGMLKLLYPDGNVTEPEAMEIIRYATECRKRVKDQLYLIDETFAVNPAKFEYIRLSDGATIRPETLENISYPRKEVRTQETTALDDDDEQTPTQGAETPRQPRPRIVKLASKEIPIMTNQTGVSYKKLFGDYLKTAKRIDITDPYIRAPFQIDNLIEFIQVCRECCDLPEELTITLNTQNTDEKIPEMIDTFDALQNELSGMGIDFSYRFEADHDRYIVLDNGWKILLSRGLDIFDKFDRFSLGLVRQENRRCRECSITFIET